MELKVNGEARRFAGPLSISELLSSLGVAPERVAVEVNRAVIPRARHPDVKLSDGDEVEVVTFVGGG